MSATPLTVFYQSIWNFADVFFMVWGCACGLDIIVRLFFVTFPLCELSHFSTSVYRQWVPCERNSSYNFYTDLFETLHMFSPWSEDVHVVWIYPCINFRYFSHFVNFVIFWPQFLWKFIDSGYFCECNSSYNFIPIFLKLCTCFLHGLEMCIWFGYNRWINFCDFVTFSALWTLSFSDFRLYESV